MLKYSDPWKDDPYGKIIGDKNGQSCKVVFSEANVYPTDNGYVIAGKFEAYEGIERAYKPEQGMKPGLCALPIYKEEYELRHKNQDGQYETQKHKPTEFEKWLCTQIEQQPSIWDTSEMALNGSIAFIPNNFLQSLPEPTKSEVMTGNAQVSHVPKTDLLPKYEIKTYQKKGSNNYRGLSPEDKLAFIKKELAASTTIPDANSDDSLADLVADMVSTNKDNESFLVIFFDLLKACVS